jgi:hypothetical protein
MVHGFLLGVIACSSVVAGMHFLNFWRQTRDILFLAFGVAFVVEGINRASLLLIDEPSRGHVVVYLVRLSCYLLILSAIIFRNRRR